MVKVAVAGPCVIFATKQCLYNVDAFIDVLLFFIIIHLVNRVNKLTLILRVCSLFKSKGGVLFLTTWHAKRLYTHTLSRKLNHQKYC